MKQYVTTYLFLLQRKRLLFAKEMLFFKLTVVNTPLNPAGYMSDRKLSKYVVVIARRSIGFA